MQDLPDLTTLSHAQKDELIVALWQQVQTLTAQVQQMQLLWQTLEAIPCLLAMWTFNSRLRTDGKDRCVSRQARWAGHEVCPPGFLVGASVPGVVSVFWPVAGASSPVAYI